MKRDVNAASDRVTWLLWNFVCPDNVEGDGAKRLTIEEELEVIATCDCEPRRLPDENDLPLFALSCPSLSDALGRDSAFVGRSEVAGQCVLLSDGSARWDAGRVGQKCQKDACQRPSAC